MIFEMICGVTPFYKEGMDQLLLFQAIVFCRYKFPDVDDVMISEDSKDLIRRILVIDQHRRLGSLAGGEKDIFRAAWFDEIKFDMLRRKEIPAPWVPDYYRSIGYKQFR
jgi:serine/threonine protein kinase